MGHPLYELSSILVHSMPVSIDSKYRADIDGLRAIAVSAVVIFHAFPNYLTGGFAGVDIFFVISGYLISSIIYNELDKSTFSFIQFYCRRIRRIFPSLIIVLVACYLAGWHVYLPPEYKKLGAHIAAASCFSSNFLLYSESGYFDEASNDKPLLHLWSLAIEEQFYIIWPVILYVSWQKKLNLLTVTILLTISSFTLNIVKIKIDKVQTFYWPTTRAWELLIGACLASQLISANNCFENYKKRLNRLFILIIYRRPLQPNNDTLCNVTSIFGTLLIILPMYFLTKESVFPGWWAVAPTVGTGLLIFVGPAPWINRKILCSRLLIGIGRISYPLYLWHWPLLIYTRIFLGEQTSYNIRITIIFLSIIIAWITHACIENPFRFGQFLQVKFVFLCIVMVGIGFVGYHTYRSDGLRYRFPPVIQEIVNSDKQRNDTWTSWRASTCFLHPHQDESKFGACVDNAEKPVSMGVILWGDSYAAHLYPGISAIKPVVRVTQLTAASCPPILGYQSSELLYCKQINEYISNVISRENPDTVILAAFWFPYHWKNLTNTVAKLRNTTVKNIYLVGPAPDWKNLLSRCVYEYFLHDKLHRVPDRMRTCLVPSIDILDQQMDAFAKEIKINYISLYKILCNSEGCLTTIGRNDTLLTTYDAGHLTVPASTFVVSNFPNTLLHFLLGK